jgi:shikimate kinase/3-dehydroquinate synthase
MLRPLLIVGPPRAGKSSLARAVAQLTGRPRLRADAASLDAHLAGPPVPSPVIDVASEVWLDRGRRLRALERAVVASVVPSLGFDGPVGSVGDEDSLGQWWALAKPILCEAHGVLSWDAGDPAQLAERAAALWRRNPVAVAAGERSYAVDIGRGIFEPRLAESLGAAAAWLITDSNVERLYGARVRAALGAAGARPIEVVVPAGEQNKNLATMTEILQEALRGGVDRSCVLVAVGGGVVTDMGGFAAAIWMRGLRWLSVPTTLLGMVDASVGGKTAVDLGLAKNAVGAFWQPRAVVCDVDWLATESERNFRSALAEVVKSALIGDRSLFERLEQQCELLVRRDPDLLVEVVRRCVAVKAHVVSLDERESGLRSVLNLGHTVGHAMEAGGGYQRFTHGEAVSLGIVAALRLAVRLGHTPAQLAHRVSRLLGGLGLPVRLEERDLRQAADLVCYDKKRAGRNVRFVVVREVGDVFSTAVLLEDLRELMLTLSD